MTTAHRATWNSKRGNLEFNASNQLSSKDLPYYKILKKRNFQEKDLNKIKNKDIMYKELIDKEKNSNKLNNEDPDNIINQLSEEENNIKNLEKEINFLKKKRKNSKEENNSENLDNNIFEQDKDYSYSESYQDNSSDIDSEEELMKELEKIKKEQKEEKLKKEDEIKEKIEKEIYLNNTLNSFNSNDYSLKRKWYEDTVFRNQNKIENKPKKRFINDTLRSEFNRKFLEKIIH